MAIEANDPVVGFVLGKSYRWCGEGVTGNVGASPFWQALSLPFRGFYDDYGFVKKLDRNFAPLSLKASTGIDFSAIEKGAEGKDVEVDLGHPYGSSKLMIMLVHMDVFEAMTAKTAGPSGREHLFGPEAARFDEFMTTAAASAKQGTIGRLLTTGESFIDLNDFIEEWADQTGRRWTEAPQVADFFVRSRCDGTHPLLQRAMTRTIGQLHAEGRLIEARAILDECLRVVFFDRNLERLRRQWQPQGGLGSQDSAYGLHAEVAAIITKRCEIRSSPDYDGPDYVGDDGPLGP